MHRNMLVYVNGHEATRPTHDIVAYRCAVANVLCTAVQYGMLSNKNEGI